MGKKIIGIAVAVAAILFLLIRQDRLIKKFEAESEKYRANTTALMEDVTHYKLRDSLSGARADALELSMKELEKWRAEDAEIIKDLKIKNRDLSAINKAQTQTIIELRANGKDTIVIVDSIPIPAQTYHIGDKWYDFDALVADRQMTGKLAVRDSLLLVEQVQYKRFLFWQTKKIKERSLDCVSKNPYTSIMGVERIIIEK